jgi:hypothetical protein
LCDNEPMALFATLLSTMVAIAPAQSAPPPPSRALLLVDVALDVPGRAGLEERIHAALGPRVLDQAATAKIRADLRDLGLSCETLDERCAAGHGQFVGVGEVVVVVVEPVGSSWLVRATRVGVAEARALDTAVGRLAVRADDGGVGAEVVAANLFAAARAPVLVPLRITGLPDHARLQVDGAGVVVDAGFLWLPPGDHAVALEGAPPSTSHTVALDDRSAGVTMDGGRLAAAPPVAPTATAAVPSGPGVVPVVVVAAGALAIVAGGSFAWFVDDQLDPRKDPDLSASARAAQQTTGQLGVAVAVAGSVAAVVGLALWGSTP